MVVDEVGKFILMARPLLEFDLWGRWLFFAVLLMCLRCVFYLDMRVCSLSV